MTQQFSCSIAAMAAAEVFNYARCNVYGA